MKRLVILRPEPGASNSVERARAMDLEALAISLFEIRPLPWTAPDPARFDAILMTSANAARHGGEQLKALKSLPVHAVGQATADAATKAGFTVATVGTGDGAQLAAQLADGLRLLHLGGRQRRPLRSAEAIAVYEAVALPDPPGLDRLPGSVVAVHSPRAGRRLAELAETKADIAIAAISTAAASACGPGWKRVEVAPAPNDAALLALAAQLCQKPGR